MDDNRQEHVSISIYDSRFTIEDATRDGKPVFLVLEHTSAGTPHEYIENTFLDAICRFASCIETQARFHMRNDPAISLPDNGMLTADACVAGSREDNYKGKIVILKPESLRPEYRRASEQLFYARNGFGCSATARGKFIAAQNLYTGYTEGYGRDDFMGIADPQKLPAWALPALRKLTMSDKTQDGPDNDKDRPKKPPTR